MDSEDIKKFFQLKLNDKIKKNSTCSCGAKKQYNYKTCCKCNNRKKKQLRLNNNI